MRGTLLKPENMFLNKSDREKTMQNEEYNKLHEIISAKEYNWNRLYNAQMSFDKIIYKKQHFLQKESRILLISYVLNQLNLPMNSTFSITNIQKRFTF